MDETTSAKQISETSPSVVEELLKSASDGLEPAINLPEPVIRGGVAIPDREQLRGLLALGLRLENVGVLLGAGASKPAGGQVMWDIWQSIIKNAPKTVEWLADENLFDPGDGETVPNVEELLSKLDLRIHAFNEIADTKRVREASDHQTILRRAVARAAFLNPGFWTRPDEAGVSAELKHHRQLLERLIGSRQPGQNPPWLFTTNYDLAVEWSAEALGIHVVDGFAGVHARRFEPSSFDLGMMNMGAKGEARFGSYNLFLGKLHGSLTWTERNGELTSRPCTEMHGEIELFIDGTKTNCSSTIIFPSSAKYVDTVGFVYGEMLRRFSEFLSKKSTLLLVSGYGFGDRHINRLLASGLRNPTLQLVVYLPEFSTEKAPDNPYLRTLLERGGTQVTIVGGGQRAYFDQMVADLPDPAHIDQTSIKARELARLLQAAMGGEHSNLLGGQ